jgi:ribosomal protein S18 acetylase RimI-like enzyme
VTPTIRPMTHDDLPTLAAWMVDLPLFQGYNLTVERTIANFEAGLSRGDWLITADADSPADGFAWAIPNGAFGRSPYLRLIGVRADVTSRGIGAALLTEIERRAAENSNDLFLLVSDFNEDAQRFYRRQGYMQIGAIPDYVVPGVAELIFRKRLS